MKRSSLQPVLAATAALALGCAAFAGEQASNTVKFSDPAKPGTLKIALARGDIQITGSDTTEVTVESDARPQTQKRKDGLRVLTEAAGFSLNEKDNVITLDALSEGWAGAPSDFRITVPKNTNVIVNSNLGGDVRCASLTGDIEIKSIQGEVTLVDVAGGALVDTMNGEIEATIRELQSGKPLSFTSMNGAVILRVPGDTKANVRFRTQNGTILTDFDDAVLKHKVEASSGPRHRGNVRTVLDEETRQAIREVGRASAEVARRTAEAIREAAEAAREGAEAAVEAGASAPPMPPLPPKPPKPPVPFIPTITGGKIVSGTLNGGGPEISVTTMNGDVTLRQLKK